MLCSLMNQDIFYEQIKYYILKKLFDMKAWMSKHTNIHNMQRGFLLTSKRKERLKNI